MNKKIKLFSLISALAVGATMAFTACGDDEVAEHEHDWNDGTVTTASTCSKEGVRTYACKVEGCEQTKTEPIAKIPHSWNGGEITTEPKCNAEGVKTYTCTAEGCGQTKTEPVDKTAHHYDEGEITKIPDFLVAGEKTLTCEDCNAEKKEPVGAHADFSEQFYTTLTEQNNWYYGYMTSFGAETSEADFVQLEQSEGGVWKAEGIEIGNGFVSGDNAAIAYRFAQALPEKTQTDVSISFSGKEDTTCLNAYLIINGECVKTIEENSKDWSFKTEEALDIAQGDTFCIVFKNAGAGAASGELSITFTAPCIHVYDGGTVTKPATCTEEGEKEYACVSCDETYTVAIEKTAHVYDEGEKIKDATETEMGEIKYTCKNEGCGNYYIEYTPKLGIFNGADYTKDFSLEPQSDWKYGYASNFNFGTGAYTFNDLTPNKSTGAWVDAGGGIEIKSDWIKNESTTGTNAAIVYKMPQTREIDIALTFKGSDNNTVTRIAARLIIQKADGTIQSCDFIEDGKTSPAWTYNKTATVEAGSTVSVVFFNEGEAGYFHGNFSMTLNIAGQQPHDHTYEEDVEKRVDATCHSDGVKTLVCECGDEKTEPITVRPAHDYNETTWVSAGTEGHYHECKNCDAHTDPEQHHITEDRKEPTADEEGYIKSTCDDCDYEDTVILPTTNHEQGMTYAYDDDEHWFVCTAHEDCGAKFEKGTHQYGEWQVITEATFWTEGEKTRSCACGATETDSVAKLNSTTTNVNDEDWKFGIVNYHFSNEEDPNEYFTFTQATDKNGGNDGYVINGTEIKSDWFSGANFDAFICVAYVFKEDVTAEISVSFKGIGDDEILSDYSLRIGYNEVPEWGDRGTEYTVNKTHSFNAGDTVYFIFKHETNGWDQGNYSITIERT